MNKIVTYSSVATGKNIYAVFTRDVDKFILDATDMVYKAPATVGIDPVQPLTERAIDGTLTQVYEFEDNTEVWNDGIYLVHIYDQVGGAVALTTDPILGSAKLILRGDAIIDRSYSWGDEVDDPYHVADIKDVVDDAAGDIIAALGTVVNSSFEGTATGGTNTTVIDTTAAWDVDIWASAADIETLCIVESAATAVRYVVKIISNTADTLTVDALSAGYVVVVGDTYTIIRNSSAVDIKSVGGTAQTGGNWTTLFTTTNTNTTKAGASTIYNISCAVIDTEYSQALPANTKAFAISIIDGVPGSNFRIAFETGKVATPTAPNLKIDQGFEYGKDGLILTGATIYIASSTVAVAQLEVWV